MKIDLLEAKGDDRGVTTFLSYKHGRPKLVHSTSVAGVLKGFHFQTKPWCHKTVYVVRGKILDVCINLNKNNYDYGLPYFEYIWAGAKIEVPVGWAHGYFSLTDSEIIYDFSPFWDYESTYSLDYHYADNIWKQEELGIHDAIISKRDYEGLTLPELEEQGLVYYE